MNERFTLFLFFCFSFIALKAQGAFPLFEEEPVWYLSNTIDSQTSSEEVYYESEVSICGETWNKINGVVLSGVDSVFIEYGYLRTEGDKTYFRSTLNCEDSSYVLYDFSLQQGDTLSSILYNNIIEEFVPITYEVIFKNQVGDLLISYDYEYENQNFSGVVLWQKGIGSSKHPIWLMFLVFSNTTNIENTLKCLMTIHGRIYNDDNFLCSSCRQKTFVDQGAGDGLNNGTSWENAFLNLQDALAIAAPEDTIWVAEGTYVPTETQNRHQSFLIQKGVQIFGGFSGSESQLSERNLENSVTILSGDIGVENELSDNVFHVVRLKDASGCTLDGFTIKDGNADSNDEDTGGGIIAIAETQNAYPNIHNCIFEDNYAKNKGGAIHLEHRNTYSVVPHFEHCKFKKNQADFGGAIHTGGVEPINTDEITFLHCNFIENKSLTGGGGAVYSEVALSMYFFQHCNFLRDTANYYFGGAIGIDTYGIGNTSLVKIDQSYFEGNTSTGGAFSFFYIDLNNIGNSYTFEITNSIFKNNDCPNNTGGAIGLYGRKIQMDLEIANCEFRANESMNGGGAVFLQMNQAGHSRIHVESSKFIGNESYINKGGAIFYKGFSGNGNPLINETSITNSLFYNNDGVLVSENGIEGGASTTFTNCTIVENGGLTFLKPWLNSFDETFYNYIDIQNSIIWEPNQDISTIFSNYDSSNPSLYNYSISNSLLSIENCNLEGGEEACGEGNLFAVNPELINISQENFGIKGCSPAVNYGSNTFIENLGIDNDLSNQPRILNDTVDIGAYETALFQPVIYYTLEDAISNSPQSGRIQIDSIDGVAYPVAFLWSTGAQTNSIENLEPGNYDLTITDSDDCSMVFSFIIDMVSEYSSWQLDSSFQIFPNPMTDILWIDFNVGGIYFFYLFDVTGQILLKEQITPTETNQMKEINVESLSPGTYFYQLRNEKNMSVQQGKLIKVNG